MNITIYLEDALGQELLRYAEAAGQNKNAVVRQAIKEWFQNHHVQTWPEEILQFNGIKDFSPFENNRQELNPPREDPLA